MKQEQQFRENLIERIGKETEMNNEEIKMIIGKESQLEQAHLIEKINFLNGKHSRMIGDVKSSLKCKGIREEELGFVHAQT
mmetsp:Transcript_12651/g.18936  ORF Transcript_12651/g.18936 Transcript_12651/m.18936 type:complete len:81 (+) Transcript_12651:2-244(+)